MRNFLYVLSVLIVFAATLGASAVAAQPHQVTYERVVFEGSNEGDDLAWSQLLFSVEGFRIDGLCYNSCRIEFSLDGSPRGAYTNRADLRITNALVTSDFPTDFYGQM